MCERAHRGTMPRAAGGHRVSRARIRGPLYRFSHQSGNLKSYSANLYIGVPEYKESHNLGISKSNLKVQSPRNLKVQESRSLRISAYRNLKGPEIITIHVVQGFSCCLPSSSMAPKSKDPVTQSAAHAVENKRDARNDAIAALAPDDQSLAGGRIPRFQIVIKTETSNEDECDEDEVMGIENGAAESAAEGAAGSAPGSAAESAR